MKSDVDSYRLHRKVCSVLCLPLFLVNMSTWPSGNVPQCGSCCNIGALRWPHMFLPLWMQTHTHVHQWRIWDPLPLTHKKDAQISVWSEAFRYMTCIRNTNFSNKHQTYKQISDKYTFLRSTASEEQDFTKGNSLSTAYWSKESFFWTFSFQYMTKIEQQEKSSLYLPVDCVWVKRVSACFTAVGLLEGVCQLLFDLTWHEPLLCKNKNMQQAQIQYQVTFNQSYS